jgi:hypothetical protein
MIFMSRPKRRVTAFFTALRDGPYHHDQRKALPE